MSEIQSLILQNAYEHYIKTGRAYTCLYPSDVHERMNYQNAIQDLSDNGYINLCGKPGIAMRIIEITFKGIDYISS